jgi:hypothetical protein
VGERCVRRGSYTAVQALEKAMLDYLHQSFMHKRRSEWLGASLELPCCQKPGAWSMHVDNAPLIAGSAINLR